MCSVSSVKIKGDCVRIVYIGGIDDHHCLNVFLIKENKNINTTTQNNLKNIILVSVNNKYFFSVAWIRKRKLKLTKPNVWKLRKSVNKK